MLQLQEALSTAAMGKRRPEGGDKQPHLVGVMLLSPLLPFCQLRLLEVIITIHSRVSQKTPSLENQTLQWIFPFQWLLLDAMQNYSSIRHHLVFPLEPHFLPCGPKKLKILLLQIWVDGCLITCISCN